MREYQRRSGNVPKPIRDWPGLNGDNKKYWAAYLDLDAAGSISYGEIAAYAGLMNLDPTELTVKIHAIGDALHEDRRVTGTDSGSRS